MVQLSGTPLKLRDGSEVFLRFISSEDKGKLADFHGRLSDQTIYLRHFAFHPKLSEAELEYFTNLNHESREAVVATYESEIVAVARFDRVSESEAEVAFVIRDDFQRLGLGSGLFQVLREIAVTIGIEFFVAEVLPQNRAMIRLFEVFGDAIERETDAGITTVRVKIV